MNTDKEFAVTFSNVPPVIAQARAIKYTEIRTGIDQIAAGVGEKYLIITCETKKRAELIAQSVSAYRATDERLTHIRYRSFTSEEGEPSIMVWDKRRG